MQKTRIGTERRKFLRINMLEPFVVKFQVSKGRGILQLSPKKIATIKNISAGGILVELPLLKPNQVDKIIRGKNNLFFELKIPSFKEPFRIPGKIIWLEKRSRHGKMVYLAGIAFEYLKEKDKEKILPLLISLCLKGRATI